MNNLPVTAEEIIALLLDYLEDNYSKLPRTALRYAIEKLPEQERQYWLKRK